MRMPAVGITCYPSQGGSGVVATELGLHLARHGCEIHFITSDLPFRLRGYDENIFYHKVEMPHYPVFQHSPYTLALATAMSDVAVRCNLDILHVHYAIPHAAAAFLAREMVGADKLKMVTTLHGTDITLVGQEPSFFPITKFLLERSDAVTAVSTFLKEETLRVFKTGGDIQVIPNFIDGRIFKPRDPHAGPRRFGDGQEKLLMHASNFRPVKNVAVVVEAFARLTADLPCRLLLLGEGPELPLVREQVQKLGVQDKVEFLGQVDNLERVLPEADVLLLPSLHESFGLVALEAMACGVVPLVTNRGGAGEFIVHGSNGYLLDPMDVDAWHTTARDLLRDEAQLQHVAEEARRDAVGDFGAGCVLKDYLNLYERLL